MSEGTELHDDWCSRPSSASSTGRCASAPASRSEQRPRTRNGRSGSCASSARKSSTRIVFPIPGSPITVRIRPRPSRAPRSPAELRTLVLRPYGARRSRGCSETATSCESPAASAASSSTSLAAGRSADPSRASGARASRARTAPTGSAATAAWHLPTGSPPARPASSAPPTAGAWRALVERDAQREDIRRRARGAPRACSGDM